VQRTSLSMYFGVELKHCLRYAKDKPKVPEPFHRFLDLSLRVIHTALYRNFQIIAAG